MAPKASTEPNQPLQPNQEAFWKAYTFSLKNLVLPEPSEEALFFPAVLNTIGVLAGEYVPKEVTNYGVYKWADGLLSASDPIYTGAGNGSYISNLQKYLSYVDVGADPDPGPFNAYLNAVKLSQQAKANYETEFQKAIALQKEDPGTYPTLEEWARDNYPSFLEAREAMQSAIGDEMNLRLQVYGPQADQLNRAMQNIVTALSNTSEPGLNMEATTENVELDDAESLAAAQGKKVEFPPSTSIWVPEYSIQGPYEQQVATWSAQMTAHKLRPISVEIDIEHYGNSDWEQAGFSEVTGEGLVGWFIGAFANYDRKDEFEKTFSSMTKDDFSCTLQLYGQETFELNSGGWDVPDVTNVFPKLREDAPKDLVNMVQPKAVVMAYTTGMEVTFNDQYATEFASHFQSIETEEGGFVIFGIEIELGGKRTKQTETTTHKATYDEQGGKLTIYPNNNGNAVLLGMIGQKLASAPL
ncbi:hypothetical protein ABW20_dc0106539 [Dactylellina cionopaga]|nr:hypothetical protein ABW20_dc0106539 [Dactylellina cionopaga]